MILFTQNTTESVSKMRGANLGMQSILVNWLSIRLWEEIESRQVQPMSRKMEVRSAADMRKTQPLHTTHKCSY